MGDSQSDHFSQWCLNLMYLIELFSEEAKKEDKEHTCETLLMCIVTVLSHGLRSGGGVGDVLRKPSKEVSFHRMGGRGGRERKPNWVYCLETNWNRFSWKMSNCLIRKKPSYSMCKV